jgi:hypothetical protein
VSTGNPRLDELFARARRTNAEDREAVRRAAGARRDQHLVVLAIKYRDRHQAVLRALADAVAAMPDVHLAMKPHPADPREPYRALAASLPNAAVIGTDMSLIELTLAARVLVTVNSTAAIEAMALDVPALALALPNYLSPFVEAGAMVGTTTNEEVAPALQRLVRDEAYRAEVTQRSAAFMRQYDIGGGEGASRRAAEAVLEIVDARRS